MLGFDMRGVNPSSTLSIKYVTGQLWKGGIIVVCSNLEKKIEVQQLITTVEPHSLHNNPASPITTKKMRERYTLINKRRREERRNGASTILYYSSSNWYSSKVKRSLWKQHFLYLQHSRMGVMMPANNTTNVGNIIAVSPSNSNSSRRRRGSRWIVIRWDYTIKGLE